MPGIGANKIHYYPNIMVHNSNGEWEVLITSHKHQTTNKTCIWKFTEKHMLCVFHGGAATFGIKNDNRVFVIMLRTY